MELHPGRSQAVIERIANRLGISLLEAADGILRVANANMERAIRVVSVERGYDPREFALVAFGGCGGLHACSLAAGLGIRTVIAPYLAGALSALGMLLADRVRDYSASALGRDDLESRLEELERTAAGELPGCLLERSADLRYAGQSYELTVPWSQPSPEQAFHEAHQQIYGYSDPARRVEVVSLRVRAVIRVHQPKLPSIAATKAGAVRRRRIWIDGEWRRAPVLPRAQAGGKKGPALIADYGSTTLVPEGWNIALDRSGSLILTHG